MTRLILAVVVALAMLLLLAEMVEVRPPPTLPPDQRTAPVVITRPETSEGFPFLRTLRLN